MLQMSYLHIISIDTSLDIIYLQLHISIVLIV